MTEKSNALQKLKSDLVAANQLVRRIDLIECKTPLQHLKLRGFILISHSAIEEYLESVCRDAARRSKKKFKETGVITKSAISLVATCVVDKISDSGRKKITSSVAQNLELFLNEAVNTFEITITNNNGITLKDQAKLLLPIGVDLSVEDLPLSQDLNAFGKKRGDVAHHFQAQSEDTLSDIKSRLNQIETSLEALDLLIIENSQ